MVARTGQSAIRRVAVLVMVISAIVALSTTQAGAGPSHGPRHPHPPPVARPCIVGLLQRCTTTSITFTHLQYRSIQISMEFPFMPPSLAGKLGAFYDLTCADGTHETLTLLALYPLQGGGLENEGGWQGEGGRGETTCVLTQTLRGTWVVSASELGDQELFGFVNTPPFVPI